MAGKTMPVKSRDRGLNSILNSALEHGESNNVLLLGQRPKLESILPAEVTIYLDGILCPTDNIALREIARQMDLISNLEEDATSHGFVIVPRKASEISLWKSCDTLSFSPDFG
ncbi:MAG: hypothetical protein SGCHY_001588 [Lobulomycetales sp.]